MMEAYFFYSTIIQALAPSVFQNRVAGGSSGLSLTALFMAYLFNHPVINNVNIY